MFPSSRERRAKGRRQSGGAVRLRQDSEGPHENHPPPRGAGGVRFHDTARVVQPTAFGQVFLIQSAAAVDSLWPCPGFGQLAGARMLGAGMVMTRSRSQVMKGYSGLFLLNPVTASLYPW